MDDDSKLLQAFQCMTDAMSERIAERNKRRERILALKKLVKQQGDELQRLDEEVRELREKSKTGSDHVTGDQELHRAEKKLSDVEKKVIYWSGLYKLLRVILRIKLSCKDPADHAKVTFGWLLDRKDVAKTSVIISEDPSQENVDAMWEALRQLQQEAKPKKKDFKEVQENRLQSSGGGR